MISAAVGEPRESFRATELRLRLLLLGDGSETPGLVRGEEPRRRVAIELRRLREAFDAVGDEARRAVQTTAGGDDLELGLLRIAAGHARSEPEPALLTPAECARALQVSVGTVYRAVRRGDIRGVRSPQGNRRALRIPATELETLRELRERRAR